MKIAEHDNDTTVRDFALPHAEEELDALLDRAAVLWDRVDDDGPVGDAAIEELLRVVDMIETYERELYPEFWELNDSGRDDEYRDDDEFTSICAEKEKEMDYNFTRYYDPSIHDGAYIIVPPSLSQFGEYIVERGQQWQCEDTLTFKLEGMIPIALESDACVVEPTEAQLTEQGYLGQYTFLETLDVTPAATVARKWHIICPEVTKVEKTLRDEGGSLVW